MVHITTAHCVMRKIRRTGNEPGICTSTEYVTDRFDECRPQSKQRLLRQPSLAVELLACRGQHVHPEYKGRQANAGPVFLLDSRQKSPQRSQKKNEPLETHRCFEVTTEGRIFGTGERHLWIQRENCFLPHRQPLQNCDGPFLHIRR